MANRSPSQVPPFMRLPAELRAMIFELCFDLSCAFGYVHNDTDPPDDLERKDNNWCKTPSILLVSHQVHSEASAVLYNKELVFTSGCRPFVFVRSVSKILLQKLRKVTFNMDLCRCAKWDFPFQRRWGEPSPWGELFLLLDAVWGQGHNLQRLRFTFRGSEEKMLHEPWIATFVLEDLIRRILNSFPRVEGIPHIEVCDLIDWRPRSSTKQYLLHGLELYTMMLKNEDPSAEERLNDYWYSGHKELHDMDTNMVIFVRAAGEFDDFLKQGMKMGPRHAAPELFDR